MQPTWAEININALRDNFKKIKAAVGDCELTAVVKANAYGHSAKEVVPVLEREGADRFAVATLSEALELREFGITKPILILGYTSPVHARLLAENDVVQCVYSPENAAALSQNASAAGVNVKIHIKLDTGMGRLGFDCRDDSLRGIEDAINAARLPHLDFCGLFTHFAVSDRTPDEEDGFTDEQYKRFCAAAKRFEKAGLRGMHHCCNTAASLLDADKRLDGCRVGIALYGLVPAVGLDIKVDLTPVMTLKSTVSMVKDIRVGDTVSYGRTFKAEKNMRIATVSAGYADGYPRLLSNKGHVIVAGKRANIIGRVCMDQFSIDVTDIPDVKMGDEVILFGKELPVEEIAEISNTINYEIICGVSPRVPRITVE